MVIPRRRRAIDRVCCRLRQSRAASRPLLDLPEVVKDLTAERVGDTVTLHWTTPDKTTDRIAIKGTITAEICRISIPVTPLVPLQLPHVL
ncbi:hypothetical protein [Tunturiibacter gelidiferens]|uniref:hypothetical protein n=1 Tax=Tunturiibacter gelidiferens TaxID=3069689 RepID=UPI003D9B3F9A